MNNIQFAADAFVAFLAVGLLSLFYWYIARKVLVRSVKFRLFARRDALRMLAITKAEDVRSFAYVDLEDYICKAIAYAPCIGLAQLFWFWLAAPSAKGPSADLVKFQKEASTELQTMRTDTTQDVVLILALN